MARPKGSTTCFTTPCSSRGPWRHHSSRTKPHCPGRRNPRITLRSWRRLIGSHHRRGSLRVHVDGGVHEHGNVEVYVRVYVDVIGSCTRAYPLSLHVAVDVDVNVVVECLGPSRVGDADAVGCDSVRIARILRFRFDELAQDGRGFGVTVIQQLEDAMLLNRLLEPLLHIG